MESLFHPLPEDLSGLSDQELSEYVAEAQETVESAAADPGQFTNDDRDQAALMADLAAGVEQIERARAELTARAEAEVVEETETIDVDASAQLAELVARARGPEDEAEENEEPEDEPEATETAAVDVTETPTSTTASAGTQAGTSVSVTLTNTETGKAARVPLRRSRAAAPAETTKALTPITAAAGAPDLRIGQEFQSETEIADAMIRARRAMGNSVPPGESTKVPVAFADWKDKYPNERQLGQNEAANLALVASATDQKVIKANLAERLKAPLDKQRALTAAGGLCAPVTPYYNLQMISTTDRPVRGALPSFNADRGGLRYARPPALSAVTTAVGGITAANDALGGTSATKSCQVITCPSFTETDVVTVFHCVQYGNLPSRTFPELVTHMNQLVLSAQARYAESLLLTAIDAASTAVTANSLDLGASADLLSQVLVAADGIRSRHRMGDDAVLRAMFPFWVDDLIVSDVYRSQFQRWDMTPDRFVALLRAANIEPSFYLDGASGKGQVFGTQAASNLLTFPPFVQWYLFPEGSFIFLDGGTLELGIVRDHVLNSTNDYQIFGETFEAVAFVGVESLAIQSAVCDSGITAGTHNIACPYNYAEAS